MTFLQRLKNVVNYSTADVERIEPKMVTKTFQERYADNGIFTYDEEGFAIKLKDGISEEIKWTEIERLVAYKLDLMTIDEICLDIIYRGYKITITEETKGWYQFVEKSKLTYNISDDWDTNIAYPAFATNLTILYEKDTETLQNGNNFYACFKGISKEEIKAVFESKGWASRKAGWDEFELTNNWSEFVVESHYQETLLSGAAIFNDISVAILDEIFLQMKIEFKYEFYDRNKNLLFENKTVWK
jgi:hypothetical protein